MILILWLSAGLASLAGGLELVHGRVAFGAALLVLACVIGPAAHSVLNSGPGRRPPV